MRKFIVEVKEVLSKEVEVKANSKEEAIDMVQQQYDQEEIVLDWQDLAEQTITVIKK